MDYENDHFRLAPMGDRRYKRVCYSLSVICSLITVIVSFNTKPFQEVI